MSVGCSCFSLRCRNFAASEPSCALLTLLQLSRNTQQAALHGVHQHEMVQGARVPSYRWILQLQDGTVDIALSPFHESHSQTALFGLFQDIWGAACILFEISALFPLFPGTDEKDQIRCVMWRDQQRGFFF
jgi:hypothetical protein